MTEREGRIPAISGIGKAVGRDAVSNVMVDELLGKKTGFVDRVMGMTGTGIKQRFWVPIENYVAQQTASDLVTEALVGANEMGVIDKNELRKIVVGEKILFI